MCNSKFVLVGQPRTGTTLLMDLLNSVSGVFCDNELFNPYEIVHAEPALTGGGVSALIGRDRDHERFLLGFFDSHQKKRAVGFNYMLSHSSSILDWLKNNPEIQIVYLHRKNKLAQYSSWRLALEKKEWATRSYTKSLLQRSRKIQFEYSSYLDFIGIYGSLDKMFQALVAAKFFGDRVLVVEYCDLFHPEKAVSRILNHLSVESSSDTSSNLKKQSNSNILKRFRNPDFTKKVMSDVGCSEWLGIEYEN